MIIASVALSAAFAATAEPPLPAYVPVRAPSLASLCATPEDAGLAERRVAFCAGYVRAVLENDPRLGDCHPLPAEVLDEIVARQRTSPPTDDNMLARDFVVGVARDLCRRVRPS